MQSNWQDLASCARLVSGVNHEPRSVTSDVRASVKVALLCTEIINVFDWSMWSLEDCGHFKTNKWRNISRLRSRSGEDENRYNHSDPNVEFYTPQVPLKLATAH